MKTKRKMHLTKKVKCITPADIIKILGHDSAHTTMCYINATKENKAGH